jgi:hypothetical protein
MELTLALFAGAIVLAWNIVATRRVAVSSYYTQDKKLAQYLIIWLLPVIGATLAYSLTKEEKTERVATDLTTTIEQGDATIRLDSATGNPLGNTAGHD